MNISESRPSIVFVVPSLSAGGVATVAYYAATELARSKKYHVSLLSLHDEATAVQEEASGLYLVSLGWQGPCSDKFLEWLNENHCDVMISNDVSNIEAAFPFMDSSIKHIVYVHDSQPAYRNVALRNASWVDGVVSVANHITLMLRPSLDDLNFSGLIETIHNGASFPPFMQSKPSSSQIRLLFMGSMDPIKGIQDLPSILAHLKKQSVSFSLDIAGGFSDDVRHKLEKIGVSDHVTWLGRVPHEECYKIASQADVFLMLSRREPFGMVTIEAMSMSCAVIGYDTPSGTAEIVVHEENGFLVPLMDYAAVADAISRLASQKPLLQKMAKSAEKRARENFSSRQMGVRLERMIDEVLTKPNSNSRKHPDKFCDLRSVKRFSLLRHRYQKLPENLRLFIRRAVYSNKLVVSWLIKR